MAKVSELKAQAESLEQQGQLQQALTIYQHVLKHLEGTPAIKRELPLYVKAGDLATKLEDAGAAVEMYECAAEQYAEHGLFKSVNAICGKILQVRPEARGVHLRYGRRMLELGHAAGARVVLAEYAAREGLETARAALDAAGHLGEEQAKPIVALFLDSVVRIEAAEQKASEVGEQVDAAEQAAVEAQQRAQDAERRAQEAEQRAQEAERRAEEAARAAPPPPPTVPEPEHAAPASADLGIVQGPEMPEEPAYLEPEPPGGEPAFLEPEPAGVGEPVFTEPEAAGLGEFVFTEPEPEPEPAPADGDDDWAAQPTAVQKGVDAPAARPAVARRPKRTGRGVLIALAVIVVLGGAGAALVLLEIVQIPGMGGGEPTEAAAVPMMPPQPDVDDSLALADSLAADSLAADSAAQDSAAAAAAEPVVEEAPPARQPPPAAAVPPEPTLPDPVPMLVEGLDVVSVRGVTRGDMQGYEVVQVLESGERLTITAYPSADAGLLPAPANARITTLQGETRRAAVGFQGFEVVVQGRATEDDFRALLARLAEGEPPG